jgi:para-nitrobenzyl esterase
VYPLTEKRDGVARGVPIIFGTNRDEDKFGEAISGRRPEEFDAETLLRRVGRMLGRHSERAAELIDVYRASRAKRGLLAENRDILSALTTDQRQRLPAIRLVEAQRPHAPAYNYLFCWEQPALKAAIHGLEIPFVFGKVGIGRDPTMQTRGPEAEQLSRHMLGAWCHFALSGDPALPELAWDPYDSQRRATMVYGEQSELVDAPFEEERAAWEGIG